MYIGLIPGIVKDKSLVVFVYSKLKGIVLATSGPTISALEKCWPYSGVHFDRAPGLPCTRCEAASSGVRHLFEDISFTTQAGQQFSACLGRMFEILV